MSADAVVPVEGSPEWAQECAALLVRESFPADQDDLLAALVRLRAPSRLLQQVARLGRERIFADLEDVLRACLESADVEPPEGLDARDHG